MLTKQSLEAQGYDVTVTEGSDPAGTCPLRPDAYVSLRAIASMDMATGIEAWFCHVDGSLSGQLAASILKSLGAAGLPMVGGQGDGDVEDPEAFRCDLLLAGRARMPTVLLEVPAAATENGEGQALAEGLAAGIGRFFQNYQASLLQEDQRRGLVWPAIGARLSGGSIVMSPIWTGFRRVRVSAIIAVLSWV